MFIFLDEHANILGKDLCQLIEQMKAFVFLDIHGKIDQEKVECYRSIIQRHFPNSRINVEKLRFRLWL